jgi:hypothetical protein
MTAKILEQTNGFHTLLEKQNLILISLKNLNSKKNRPITIHIQEAYIEQMKKLFDNSFIKPEEKSLQNDKIILELTTFYAEKFLSDFTNDNKEKNIINFFKLLETKNPDILENDQFKTQLLKSIEKEATKNLDNKGSEIVSENMYKDTQNAYKKLDKDADFLNSPQNTEATKKETVAQALQKMEELLDKAEKKQAYIKKLRKETKPKF